MSSVTIDHKVLALSRIALQYQNSPKFKAWVQGVMTAAENLEQVMQKTQLQSDIDEAEGVNLDVLGIILGRDRIIPEAIPVGFFGFFAQPGVLPYGKEGDPSKGGRFRDDSEPAFATSVLADPEYRRLLKARVIKNHGKGYLDDVLAGLAALFPDAPVVANDPGYMTLQVGVGRILRYWEKVVLKNLDMLSRPQGVLITGFTEWNGASYFGFLGQPNAKSYGVEGDPTKGGTFANEF